MANAILTDAPLDIDAVSKSVESSAFGGVVVFTGNVRDFSDSKRVTLLSYEAYAPLAQKELLKIAEEAEQRWGGACSIGHRLGGLQIGETSVVVAYAAAHRAEAFEACRWAIDTLKATVPIWKRETYEDGSSWIEGPHSIPIAQ